MSKPRKCAGKDTFERMNYLYQASNITLTESNACNMASSLYTNLLVQISKKTVQRTDLEMKRTICKGCRTLLLAGVNCRVRIKKKLLTRTCLKCYTKKIFDMNRKEYLPWPIQKDGVVEIIDYTPKKIYINETNEEKGTGIVSQHRDK